MTIKLVENYAVSMARQSIRDSLMSHGEECILLQMYHIGTDEGKAPRCPQCYDDFYKQSAQANCNDCYGTTFAGGVKAAVRVWGMFTDHVAAEQIGPKGVWTPDQRDVQCEPFPLLTEHDYLVRVRLWDATHRPTELEGYYGIQQVTRQSLRTGNRFGQWQWDVVGQKATITELQKNSPICAYKVLNERFAESSVLARAGETPVLQPDQKVVFFPVGELLPQGVFVYEQTTPSTRWIIAHNLGHLPAVHVIVNEEEVDADVSYPDLRTVVIEFQDPQVGRAEMV
jgi:hypothetical protein